MKQQIKVEKLIKAIKTLNDTRIGSEYRLEIRPGSEDDKPIYILNN